MLSRGELQRWKVRLEVTWSAEPVVIHGDRIQIQQVALNLVQNAIDAMHETPKDQRRLCLRSRQEVGEVNRAH